MSEQVKVVNRFYKTALRKEVEKIDAEIVLTDRQREIYRMYYLEHKDAGLIADTIGRSYSIVRNELRAIRRKLVRIILDD